MSMDYLYGPYAEAMREPVRQALLQGPPPKVIVAHSLGTIVLYDVLDRTGLLAALGRPARDGRLPAGHRQRPEPAARPGGRPNPVPPSLGAWSNFADRFDPVAIDATLRDEFDPPEELRA